MRRHDMQIILLAGFFCSASAMAGETVSAVSAAGAASSVRAGVSEEPKVVIQTTGSASKAIPLQQRNTNESLIPRKKKTAQTPAPTLDERNLGLGCAKP